VLLVEGGKLVCQSVLLGLEPGARMVGDQAAEPTIDAET